MTAQILLPFNTFSRTGSCILVVLQLLSSLSNVKHQEWLRVAFTEANFLPKCSTAQSSQQNRAHLHQLGVDLDDLSRMKVNVLSSSLAYL